MRLDLTVIGLFSLQLSGPMAARWREKTSEYLWRHCFRRDPPNQRSYAKELTPSTAGQARRCLEHLTPFRLNLPHSGSLVGNVPSQRMNKKLTGSFYRRIFVSCPL